MGNTEHNIGNIANSSGVAIGPGAQSNVSGLSKPPLSSLDMIVPPLHIHIHISSDAGYGQLDQIFESLAKHLPLHLKEADA